MAIEANGAIKLESWLEHPVRPTRAATTLTVDVDMTPRLESPTTCASSAVPLFRSHVAFFLSLLYLEFPSGGSRRQTQRGGNGTGNKSILARVNTTFAMIGGLILVIVIQSVIIPLLFSLLVSDQPSAPVHQSLDQFPGMPQTPRAGTPRARMDTATAPKKPRPADDRTPDGTFNGAPIYLMSHNNVRSNVHCVGENYKPDAWMQRSCQYSFMCLDTETKEFRTFQSSEEALLSEYLTQRQYMHSSSTMLRHANESLTVSLGGINQKWGKDIPRIEWAPTIVPVTAATELNYYMLPDDVVLIPFHSLNGANPGHLIWDDFLPIYTLLTMFQLTERPLLLMRYVLTNGPRGLWASCDLREEKTKACNHMMNKFLPLMVGNDHQYNLSTTQDFVFSPNTAGKSNLVCAKTAVAGIGSLTDHGVSKSHGWMESDYLTTHNHGRGGMLYNFRNFMMQNLGIPIVPAETDTPRRQRIIFSQKSSDIFSRSMDFEQQLKLVRVNFPEVQVEAYVFKTLSLQQQVEAVSDAAIYVTLCGGGAVTSMFLPKGASVIVYYSEDGGAEDNRGTHKPALLDWDLFNAMSYLRVHWMPRNTMKQPLDEKALMLLIRHELDLIASKTFFA